MEENIEVKDVQRTEYLDKNGLDMLWAKVKENTHNQVEVERNRATTQENIIIETKADKSELHSSYVSNSTFTALEERVSANTAAISGKQDTGNYLHYETLNNDGYYEIPSVCVINKGDRTDTSITSDEIKVSDENFGYTIITMDGVSNKYATDVDFALGFNLNRNGIKLQGGDNNHVLTSNGSTIDITEYAKKSEVGGNFIPYYNKYTSSDIQYHKLADRDGIELESYTVSTKLSGSDIKIHSGSESSTINRSGISISSYGGGNGNHFRVNTNSQPMLNLYDNESSIKAKIYTNEHTPVISINEHTSSGRGDDLQLSADGIKMLFKTTKDIVTANNSTAHIGLDDDQTEYTYVAPLENGKVPAKYLDLPQIDTSDFVSKNADELQIINSPVALTSEVLIVSDTEDENTDYVALEPTKLQFSKNNYTSSIELNGKDTDTNTECGIEIKANHGNPLIMLYRGITGNGNDESALEITNSGISISNSQNENIGPDKVFATNGSIADLAQYVKKSEITADGNVDDVQVNGVSVVENKVANIKPATKEKLGVVKVGDGLNVTDGVISVSAGNYLTYDSMVNEQYYISSPKSFIFNGRNVQDSASSISSDRIIVGNSSAHTYSKMLNNSIELRGDKNALYITYADITGNEYKGDDPTPYQQFVLNKKGVWLYGGDNNHVLTSNASTIDITQYVLKSVYDEKIAALEARIAALEAKHVED